LEVSPRNSSFLALEFSALSRNAIANFLLAASAARGRRGEPSFFFSSLSDEIKRAPRYAQHEQAEESAGRGANETRGALQPTSRAAAAGRQRRLAARGGRPRPRPLLSSPCSPPLSLSFKRVKSKKKKPHANIKSDTSTPPAAPRSSPSPPPAPSAGTPPTSRARPSSREGTTSSSRAGPRGVEKARPRWSL
jgi:hypothetical protein